MSFELTDEHYRLLRAAERGGLLCAYGRWFVVSGARPDFKSRRRLIARGLIDHPRYDRPPLDRPWLVIDSRRLVLTDKGREALDATTGRETR